MKTQTLIALLLSLFVLIGNAQTLDEKTSILAKKRGTQALFELHKGESLYSFAQDEGWYKIRKKVYLPQGVLTGQNIPAETPLLDANDQEIGRTLSNCEAVEIDTIEAFRRDPQIVAVLEGYVFKTKIEENSVPEEYLQQALNQKSYRDQKEMLAQMEVSFALQEAKSKTLTARVLLPKNYALGEEQDFRLILLYRGSTLYGIISHQHRLEAPKVKLRVDDSPFHTLYFFKPSESQMKEVEDLLYSYLTL